MVTSRDQNAVRNINIKTMKNFRKCRIVQIFGKDLKISTFYSGRNKEQAKIRECLLSFGAESLVFQFPTLKYKD